MNEFWRKISVFEMVFPTCIMYLFTMHVLEDSYAIARYFTSKCCTLCSVRGVCLDTYYKIRARTYYRVYEICVNNFIRKTVSKCTMHS